MLKKYLLMLPIILVAFYFALIPIRSNATTPSTLVIDEFQIGMSSPNGTASDEYIAIANYGSNNVTLDNYNLRLKRFSNTDQGKIVTEVNLYKFPATNIVVETGERIIVAKSGYAGVDTPYRYSGYISSNYTILLNDNYGNLVDLVGYGDCPEWEGQPINEVNANDIWRRKNGQDTTNNLEDFQNINAPKILPIDLNIDKIAISELMPSPDAGAEWIEIYNPTNLEINLYGLKICDTVGSTHCFSFSNTETLAPFSYKAYDSALTRITLNNSGDNVILSTIEDALIFETDRFKDATKGESYSLFGSNWQWTKAATKGDMNIFVSTLENEDVKTTKVKKAKKVFSKTDQEKKDANEDAEQADQAAVKGDQTDNKQSQASVVKNSQIGKKEIGYGLIALAILLLCGYTFFENKEKLHEIANKLKRRND